MTLFSFFKKKSKENSPAPQEPTPSPFDLIHFDTSELEYLQEDEGVHHWQTPQGDILELFHFSIPPDIEADLNSVASVRHYYRQMFASAEGAIIEVDIFNNSAGWQVIHVIGKQPQKPSGMTYTGSLTIPFADSSYLLRMSCREHGTTGIRDNMVLMAHMQEQNSSAKDTMAGWGEDPYDPGFSAPLLRNLSEAEAYDEQFPDHPLSRLRPVMKGLLNSLQLDIQVQDSK